MDNDFYKQAFQRTIDDLSVTTAQRKKLDAERETLTARLEDLKEGALGLAALCGMDRADVENTYPDLFPSIVHSDVGLTDAIRIIIKSNPSEWVSPVQIREGLNKIGFDVSKYTNPLATIHTTLKRLFDNGEINMGIDEVTGKTLYREEFEDEPEQEKPKTGKKASKKKL